MTRLKFERIRRGLSQTTLGVVCRVHQPTLARIENRRREPTPAQRLRLAVVLSIPPKELLKPAQIIDERTRVLARVEELRLRVARLEAEAAQ